MHRDPAWTGGAQLRLQLRSAVKRCAQRLGKFLQTVGRKAARKGDVNHASIGARIWPKAARSASLVACLTLLLTYVSVDPVNAESDSHALATVPAKTEKSVAESNLLARRLYSDLVRGGLVYLPASVRLEAVILGLEDARNRLKEGDPLRSVAHALDYALRTAKGRSVGSNRAKSAIAETRLINSLRTDLRELEFTDSLFYFDGNGIVALALICDRRVGVGNVSDESFFGGASRFVDPKGFAGLLKGESPDYGAMIEALGPKLARISGSAP